MIRLLAFVFSATLFAFVLAQEASALRGRGIHVGGGGIGAYRGGLRTRNFSGYRAAAWGGRPWRGARRWYGYGAGVAALAGAYAYYNDPYYDDAYYSSSYYSPAYGYASPYAGTYGYASPYAATYGYASPYARTYGYSSPYATTYGYSSGTYGYSSAAAVETDAGGPGSCGTYRYWKDR